MYLFYTDESNLDPAAGEFFVYGGIAVPTDAASQLSEALEKARSQAPLPAQALLKFGPKPTELDWEAFNALKQAYLDSAASVGCVFIVSTLLHKIAPSPDVARRFEINRALYYFDCLMHRRSDFGLVLVDRFSDSQIDAQLRERFSIGVTGLPYTDPYRLTRVLGFHYSCIGQSHFSSLIDIAIGSFRYAVNAFSQGGPTRLATARSLLALLSPLFLRNINGEVSTISLHFSPDTVRVPAYRARYDALKAFLSDAGLPTSQDISDAS